MSSGSGRNYRIRKSQIIAPYGVGAIVEFPEGSLMHAGLDAWTTSDEQNLADDRLAQRLGVRTFYEPVSAPEKNQPGGGVIPFVRFPMWHVCPRCRSMSKSNWNDRRTPQCSSNLKPRSKGPTCGELSEKRRQKMIPVRFIVACEDGHIEDFPWVEWAHTERGTELTRGTGCDNPQLRLNYTGRSGLMGLTVLCESCSKKRSMAGAASPKTLENFGCAGERPWLGPDAHEDCMCAQAPKVVQRGATNVHFAQTVSSILIPPYSTYVRRIIATKKNWTFLTGGIDESGNLDDQRIKNFAELKNIPYSELLGAIRHKLAGNEIDLTEQTEQDFRYDEYKAFCAEKNRDTDNDLNIDPQKLRDYDPDISDYFDNIVLVEKLTETRALTGFSRLNPPDGHGGERGRVARLSKNNLDWFPAVRAYGEGVFITLNQEVLDLWSQNKEVNKRASHIQERLNNLRASRGQEGRAIDPAFIVLHTLAHMLIRRLSFDCGYGSSSLRERIYCRQEGGEIMSGVLIYTAAADSEGTLGGLVRQGKPGYFEQTMRAALVDGNNCSSDPLCSESEGQGSDALNMAACHACALLPETSCEEGNRLLDRLLVIGEADNSKLGYFGGLIESIVLGE